MTTLISKQQLTICLDVHTILINMMGTLKDSQLMKLMGLSCEMSLTMPLKRMFVPVPVSDPVPPVLAA